MSRSSTRILIIVDQTHMEVDYEVLEPWRKLMERLTHLSEIRNVELVGLLT